MSFIILKRLGFAVPVSPVVNRLEFLDASEKDFAGDIGFDNENGNVLILKRMKGQVSIFH